MLPMHRVQNGHQLQEQLKTASFEVCMMTGLKNNHLGLTCLSHWDGCIEVESWI